ncbi:CoA pyrophosphatase [Zooshikella marina]|uniref:NUDIX hydrolase n=1 Tax=Zooshikella ganghwensis TaxID=202772 RepID=UPI001BAFB6AE|nr:CoA pyrophosphatase [Zooshikella ganghwensis]MBU2705694.1 CoA pyrophosphatase [Zooshikella ganghwensis]
MMTDMLWQIKHQLADYRPPTNQISLPQASVLIAITNSSVSPEIILIQRAHHLSSHSGEVAFPGGKREPQDKNLWQTALRESHEEVRIIPESVEYLGQLRSVVSRFGISVTPFVGLIPSKTNLIPCPDELECCFRVPLAFFLKSQNLGWDRLNYGGHDFVLPSYQYQQFKIWGLTAIVLADLLNTVFETNIDLNLPHYKRFSVNH